MIQRFHGHSPIIHPAARLAANATLVGCVTVEAASSIWYGAVLRGMRVPSTWERAPTSRTTQCSTVTQTAPP